MTYIDSNGSGVTETYSAYDIISLFMIIAKESMYRHHEYGLSKLIIEEIDND